VLILGGTGMLGHSLWAHCAPRFDAIATVREPEVPPAAAGVLDPQRTITRVSVADFNSVAAAIEQAKPDVVVNCIGLVKQRPEAGDVAELMQANAVFPHQLAAAGPRLIHISTDCVFSGDRGGYTESDRTDPIDLYGRSKLAGEPTGDGVLTLRTSMLGRELERHSGLLEWFLAAGDRVAGYSNAIFSGPTTPVVCRLIGDLIERGGELDGIWHVGAEPISKLALLELVRDRFGLDTEIEPDPGVRVDRSLDASRLREAFDWNPPAWEEMIEELAEEETADAER
jgi:dTDP-4-dehydrorhamnose reductase